MRIPRIYTPQTLAEQQTIVLEEQASNHLIKVLRLQEQHPIILFNGEAGCYTAHISLAHKKHAEITLLEYQNQDLSSPLDTHIAIGLSKGDKLELIIQKATELGVNSISPIMTEHSDVKMNKERAEKKLKQWQQIAISACEQSGRNILPIINPVQSFDDWIHSTTNSKQTVAFFHTQGGSKLSALDKPEGLHLCFGPEGGFSEHEIEQAKKHNSKLLTLGPRILRAETAPIACLGAAQTLWGDW
ncbi:MAG: 16S rRNA (uracil(1498)-N(3))-methyltransferase [Sinobacterium sp.]|nr:16S rRNA (uracil(1498)-N(3))-methyltransferase [Sinobacterium sp.]